MASLPETGLSPRSRQALEKMGLQSVEKGNVVAWPICGKRLFLWYGDCGGMMQQQLSGPVDLSPAATTVAFQTILPPLRIPVPAGPEDDPSEGQWVLAFKDETSWMQAWLKSREKIASQCEMGARMGCSISATNACRMPWWKSVPVFLGAARVQEGERELGEESEMRACLAAAEASCSKYARETCESVFAIMRIAEPGQTIDPRFTRPFRRKQWTRDMKDKGEGPPAGETSAEAPESTTNVKINTDYRERVMVDQVSGWEGGLIRPKVDPSSTTVVR